MSIVSLSCEIDGFFLAYERRVARQCLPEVLPIETRGRPRGLHPSEVMTILIAFHQSGYRTFKHFYLKCEFGLKITYIFQDLRNFEDRTLCERKNRKNTAETGRTERKQHSNTR